MLFVNPAQIVRGQPYFFSLLDAHLDARRISSIAYMGKRYNLDISPELRAFRGAAKQVLCSLSERDALAHVSELKDDLHAGGSAIPDHAQPLTLADLIELRDMGVIIENHGWSHIEIRLLSPSAFAEHVVRGREWLLAKLSIPSIDYAVPFGLSAVPSHSGHHVLGTVFLANPALPPMQVDCASWNRVDITQTLQEG
jgi:hypothetical protein